MTIIAFSRKRETHSSMKKIMMMIAVTMGMMMMTACNDTDENLYNQLPQNLSSFISQYYPGCTISAYEPDSTSTTVVVKDGPTIVFDKQGQWTSVDGNGEVLPQVLLFDQLPPAVYEYLQDNSDVNDVFSISRDARDYTVKMLVSTIVYDIATGEIKG